MVRIGCMCALMPFGDIQGCNGDLLVNIEFQGLFLNFTKLVGFFCGLVLFGLDCQTESATRLLTRVGWYKL